MSFDGDLVVSVSLDAAPVTSAGFGTLLIAASTLNAGFVERLRFYADGEAGDDADLPAKIQGAVADAFAQFPKPSRVAVGRIDEVAPYSAVFSPVVSDDGDVYTIGININGVDLPDATYAQQPGDGAEEIVDGLKLALDALGLALSSVDGGATMTVTADNWYDVVVLTATHSDTPAAFTLVETEAVTVADELAAVNDENSDWYGLSLESRDYEYQKDAAIWGAANSKLPILQSSNADIIGTTYDAVTPDDIAEFLKAASVAAVVVYEPDDLDEIAVGWAGGRLAIDPDRKSGTWDKAPIVGYTGNKLSSTAMANLKAKSANVFSFFAGQPVIGPGTVATGTFIDLIVVRDWAKARVTEAIANVLLAASAKGEKVGYDNEGFQAFGSAVREVLDKGERIGHFLKDSSAVVLPSLDEVDDADRLARIYRFEWGTQPEGAIHGAVIGGTISIDFDAASLV